MTYIRITSKTLLKKKNFEATFIYVSLKSGKGTTMTKRFTVPAIFFGGVGYGCAFFWAPPTETTVTMIQVFSGLFAFSGSLAGWNISSVTQIRTQIKGMKYSDKLEEFFRELGRARKELMWRWLVTTICASLTIVFSIPIKPLTNANVDIKPEPHWFLLSCISLSIAIGYALILFVQMIILTDRTIELDDFEFEQLRKKQLLPDTEKELTQTKN